MFDFCVLKHKNYAFFQLYLIFLMHFNNNKNESKAQIKK